MAMAADTYEEIYREVVTTPVPHEGLVLPNDILRAPHHGSEPRTQHERLLRAFYEFMQDAFVSAQGDVMTFGRKRERPQSAQDRAEIDFQALAHH